MKRLNPEVGKTYTNRNGNNYLCKELISDGAIMERIKDEWTLAAHGIC